MKILQKFLSLLTSLSLIISFLGMNALVAEAASLTAISDTMSNQTAAANSSHVFKFTTPTGIPATSRTVTYTFPAGFVLTGLVFGDVTASYGATTGLENALTVATSNSGTNWGAALSGQVLTLTSPSTSNAVPAGNILVVTVASTHAVNPSAGNYSITIGGTMSDSGSVTVPILSNSQVAVSATVPQTLTFSLGSNTVALGTLSTGAVTSGSHTMSLATNGTSGATVTVAGTTLTSGSNTIAACASGCSSTAGTAQFGLNLAANTTPSVGAAPSGSAPIGTAGANYGTANTFRFVTGETVATAANAINTTTYTVSYIANIATLTPAGSYSTSLTYSATANF